jgi:hypothetical protein
VVDVEVADQPVVFIVASALEHVRAISQVDRVGPRILVRRDDRATKRAIPGVARQLRRISGRRNVDFAGLGAGGGRRDRRGERER